VIKAASRGEWPGELRADFTLLVVPSSTPGPGTAARTVGTPRITKFANHNLSRLCAPAAFRLALESCHST
jgi:hypothetical protein